MSKVTVKFTVLFEEPFWIGILEHIEDGKLSATKVTFGAEPKDYELNEFILKYFYQLQFSPDVEASVKKDVKSPKRRQRVVRKQSQLSGIGTKSQQALKLQQEQMKSERKTKSRELRESEKQLKFNLKQQKKKEKHRGR